MIQCILVNLGLKWFVSEIMTNALGSITRRCSGKKENKISSLLVYALHKT